MEEALKNQVYKITLPPDLNQSTLLDITKLEQWVHKQTGYDGRNEGYTWAQQHELPLKKTDLIISASQYPNSQYQRPTVSTHSGTTP